MSFTANTGFEVRWTNNENNRQANITGHYQASNADADCSAGLLCVRGNKLPCAGFPASANVLNDNAYYMNAAASTANANDVIYACNPYDAPFAMTASGKPVAIGTETWGLGIPAGREGTFTKVSFDNESKYRFGIGNLTAAISTNTFFTIANGGQLTPAAAAPTAAGAIYFKLEGTGKVTTGTMAGTTYYDVTACINKVAISG